MWIIEVGYVLEIKVHGNDCYLKSNGKSSHSLDLDEQFRFSKIILRENKQTTPPHPRIGDERQNWRNPIPFAYTVWWKHTVIPQFFSNTSYGHWCISPLLSPSSRPQERKKLATSRLRKASGQIKWILKERRLPPETPLDPIGRSLNFLSQSQLLALDLCRDLATALVDPLLPSDALFSLPVFWQVTGDWVTSKTQNTDTGS